MIKYEEEPNIDELSPEDIRALERSWGNKSKLTDEKIQRNVEKYQTQQALYREKLNKENNLIPDLNHKYFDHIAQLVEKAQSTNLPWWKKIFKKFSLTT